MEWVSDKAFREKTGENIESGGAGGATVQINGFYNRRFAEEGLSTQSVSVSVPEPEGCRIA